MRVLRQYLSIYITMLRHGETRREKRKRKEQTNVYCQHYMRCAAKRNVPVCLIKCLSRLERNGTGELLRVLLRSKRTRSRMHTRMNARAKCSAPPMSAHNECRRVAVSEWRTNDRGCHGENCRSLAIG
jgi:5-deoxy-D-glucuronate isomerase